MVETLPTPHATDSKDEWRAWARELRATLDWRSLSGAACARLRRFPPLRHAATVLTYFPMEHEIDLTPLMDGGVPARWVATRTPDEGPLTVHALVGPVERHRLGFDQPLGNAPHVDAENIDIALVPGLVFDLYGNRLGHGMGYYDELLARMRPSAVLIGVAPAQLVADKIPTDPGDVAMHWLAADEGVFSVAR